MADVPVYFVVSQRKYKSCVLKPKWAWSWQGNTMANEIAMALSGCRSAIGQFGAKICALIRRFLHVGRISVMRKRKREKELVWSSVRRFPHVSCKDLSEFAQQDGRKKRTTKRLCVTNVTGLLLACFVVIFTKHFMFSGLLQKDHLKESEVWRKVISKQNYCHACLTRFAVFLTLPSCCVSSLLRYEDGDGR